MGIQLRQATSGKFLKGTVTGQGLFWDHTTQLWEPVNLPYLPLDAFRAVGNGIADDTAAIQRAADAAKARGGATVTATPGKVYRITAGITVTNTSNVSFNFTGATLLVDSVAAIDAITFTNCTIVWVIGGKIAGNRVYTTGYAIKWDNCTKCGTIDNIVNDLGNAYYFFRSSACRVTNPDVRGIYGTTGIRFQGTSVTQCHQLIINGHGNFDNPYPGSVDGHSHRVWGAGLACAVGDTFLSNGNIYYVSGAGITGGVAPSGIPTTNPLTSRTTPITDGTATLLYVSGSAVWISHEEWANSVEIDGPIGCLTGFVSYKAVNNDGSPGSNPTGFYTTELFGCDHPWQNAIDLGPVSDVEITGPYISSCMAGSGVRIRSTFGGDLRWRGGQVFGSALHGFQCEGQYWSIDNCNVSNASGAVSNTSDAINVAANVSHWAVRDCWLGYLGNVAERQRYSVRVEAGTSDDYQITDNHCDSVTGGISDSGTGKNKTIRDNNGNFEQFRPPIPGIKFGGFLPNNNQTQGAASGFIFRRVGTSTASWNYTVDNFAGSTGFTLLYENYDTANDHTLIAATTFTFARGKGYSLEWNGAAYALTNVYVLQGY